MLTKGEYLDVQEPSDDCVSHRAGGAMTRICIAGHIPLYVRCVASALERHSGFEVIALCESGDNLLSTAISCSPDVILIDMAMRDSNRSISALREAEHSPVVVAIALPETRPDVVAAAEAGVTGYVALTANVEQLVDAIHGALAGKLSVSPEIASVLFQHVGDLKSAGSNLDEQAHVTPREMEIVGLIDRGLSNKEIACLLGIEVSTVKNHVHNVLDKLQANSRGEAAAKLRHRLRLRRLTNPREGLELTAPAISAARLSG